MSYEEQLSPEQWKVVAGGPTNAGMVVTLASISGPIGLAQEMKAVYDVVVTGVINSPSELMREIGAFVAKQKDGPQAPQAPQGKSEGQGAEGEAKPDTREEAQALLLKQITLAVGVVQQAAPADLDAYKAWLVECAEKTSQAAKEGSFLGMGGKQVTEQEQAAIASVKAALEAPPPAPEPAPEPAPAAPLPPPPPAPPALTPAARRPGARLRATLPGRLAHPGLAGHARHPGGPAHHACDLSRPSLSAGPGVATQPHLHRPRVPVGPGEVGHGAQRRRPGLPRRLRRRRPACLVQRPLPGCGRAHHPFPEQARHPAQQARPGLRHQLRPFREHHVPGINSGMIGRLQAVNQRPPGQGHPAGVRQHVGMRPQAPHRHRQVERHLVPFLPRAAAARRTSPVAPRSPPAPR